MPNVLMRVTTAVFKAPSTEVTLAAGARQSKATFKIHKGLATSRTCESEDVVDDISACILKPLQLLKLISSFQLKLQLLFKELLQFLVQGLLSKCHGTCHVASEDAL